MRVVSLLAVSVGFACASSFPDWGGFEFAETSADAGVEDLLDTLEEVVSALPASSSRKTKSGKSSLIKGSRGSTRGILLRGSALGEIPRLGAGVEAPAAAPAFAGPIMDMRTGRTVEIPTIGNVSLKSTIYDEAEDSRILLGEAVDGPRSGTEFAIKVVFPRSPSDEEELNREIQALTDLVDVAGVMRLVYAPEGLARTPRGKLLKYAVLELLGESLQQLAGDEFAAGNMPMALIERVAVQGIRALQAVHAAGYVHGDVGYGNFLFTNASRTVLKLIDFGYARKYLNDDGSHVAPGSYPLGSFGRSLVSVSELDGHFPARRDDMMRFGEVLLKILNTDYFRLFRSSAVADIKKIKMETVPSECCSRADARFDKYFELVRILEYEQEPDYDTLAGIFTAA